MHYAADCGRREVSVIYPFLVASMAMGHAAAAKASKVYVFSTAPNTTFQVRRNNLSSMTVTSTAAGSLQLETAAFAGDRFSLTPVAGQPPALEAAPVALTLEQNRPNPFNPSTQIPFILEQTGRVVVRVFDVAGSHVATVFDGRLAEGRQTVDWDGRDGRGLRVASGVYVYTLSTESRTLSKKMVMVK